MRLLEEVNQFHLLERIARTDSIIFAEHERSVASCTVGARE